MGYYKYIRQLYKQPRKNLGDVYKQRLVEWRTQDVVVKAEHPTRIDKARAIGYKAKPGVLIARVRVKKGGRHREKPAGGRKPRKSGLVHFTPKKSLQWIAEEKAARRFVNCEVLNSYWAGEDGQHKWFEVILIDRDHPAILADKQLAGVAKQTRRVFRGLTSAGKKARGLMNKGIGSEKQRPSIRSHGKIGK